MTWLIWLSLLLSLVSLLLSTSILLMKSDSWNNTMPVEGTVVILGENGEAVPLQPTELKFFSRYAPGSRSDDYQRKQITIGESEKFSIKIPEFAATLFARTKDGKYAAVVDIGPEKPATDLVVELRPRYTVTGRLIHKGNNIGVENREILLTCDRRSDFGGWQKHAVVETFHSQKTTTDAEGFFTIDDVIPGMEYRIFISYRFHEGSPVYAPAASVEMPILRPEQYSEPFSLGEVIVR